eukprot:SAG31_NODE_14807_length_786_cov_1.783115_2_plen_78_part_01
MAGRTTAQKNVVERPMLLLKIVRKGFSARRQILGPPPAPRRFVGAGRSAERSLMQTVLAQHVEQDLRSHGANGQRVVG